MTGQSATTFLRMTPMLRTSDVARAIAFYVERLGFVLQHRSDEDGWAALQRDDIELMLATPKAHASDVPPTFTGSLYFHLGDTGAVDRLWTSLKDKARTCYPPETFHYGMHEFGIYDEDGYLLQFGAPASGCDP